MFPVVYGSATTARFVEQALIDTDPSDDFAPLPLKCNGITYGPAYFTRTDHYYCNPITCLEVAFEELDARNFKCYCGEDHN
jgi:hypothetical protein